MGKKVCAKTVLSSVGTALLVSAFSVVSSCDAFGPPFVFDNPYDPRQETTLLDSIGGPISGHHGLTHPEQIAVVHGDFLVTPNSDDHGRVVRYSFVNESYDVLSIDGSGDDPVHWIRGVCVVEAEGRIYASGWGGIHRIGYPSGLVSRFWFRRDEHEFIRLAPDPETGVWALGFHRFANGEEVPLIVHVSPAGAVISERAFPEFTGWGIESWNIAVSHHRVALSRFGDVLYFDRDNLNPIDRLIYDHDSDEYALVLHGGGHPENLYVRGLAYNSSADRFVAVGRWWHPHDRFIAYLDGTDGSFISSFGTSAEMPGYEWRGVAFSGGHEYVSNVQTGQVIRVGSWESVHENREIPLRFSQIRDLGVDDFVDPPRLYAVDERGAIHVVDLNSREFVEFFGPRGESHSDIRYPDSIFFTADAVYVRQYGNAFRYSRSGEFTGTVAEGAYVGHRFVIHDGYLLSHFHSEDGYGLRVIDLNGGESEFLPGFFPGDDVILGAFDEGVIAVFPDDSSDALVIGTFDLTSLAFRETGRIPNSAVRNNQYSYVEISAIVATPQGFLWLLNGGGSAVRTDLTGNVYRTLRFDDDRYYSGIAVDPDGRVYIGARDRIDVWGAR